MESYLENIQEYIQFFSLTALYVIQSKFLEIYGLAFLLLLISIYMLLPNIKVGYTNYRHSKILKNLGMFHLKNVAIKLSIDETVFIDYLYLIPNGIFVLKLMKYNGIIFAGDNVEQWTQVLNKKSYRFPNPLHDLEKCESAIRAVVSDCDVSGHIAFESDCQFPKGKPAKISILQDMQDRLEFHRGIIDKHLVAKWHELKNSDYCSSNTKQNDLSILVKGEQYSFKKLASIFLLLSSLLLFLYQLFDLRMM